MQAMYECTLPPFPCLPWFCGCCSRGANGGTDKGLQNILSDSTKRASFIASMTQEAVANNYSGYVLDAEMGASGASYAGAFVAFVNAFKASLAPNGLSFSVTFGSFNVQGTWCSGNNMDIFNLKQLSASSVDRLIIQDYTANLGYSSKSCHSYVLDPNNPTSCTFIYDNFTGGLDAMCSNVANSKIVIGMEAKSNVNNPIAGSCMQAVSDYGIKAVALWPEFDPNAPPLLSSRGLVGPQSDWFGLLRTFLATP